VICEGRYYVFGWPIATLGYRNKYKTDEFKNCPSLLTCKTHLQWIALHSADVVTEDPGIINLEKRKWLIIEKAQKFILLNPFPKLSSGIKSRFYQSIDLVYKFRVAPSFCNY
jgi:hypothetical protein